jgi:hypothetical protein
MSPLEFHTDLSIPSDLFWCAVVFVAAWVIYLVAYVVAAKFRWVKNVDQRLVIMANLSALAAGVLSWLFLGAHFSSPNAFWLATITAPIAFLGFCGIFILVGPANVDRSITFTILSAFKAVEDQDIPSAKLIETVPFDRIYHKRLRELSGAGVIELKANRVRITPLGDRALRFYRWLGHLLNVEPQ